MNEPKWYDVAYTKMEETIEALSDEEEAQVQAEKEAAAETPEVEEESALENLYDPNCTYADALEILESHYRELKFNVPLGGGSFEAWWTGQSGDGESPSNEITEEDVEELSVKQICDLVQNLYYNNTKIGITPQAVRSLCRIVFHNADKGNDLADLAQAVIVDKLTGGNTLQSIAVEAMM